jgi:hypothetical protein
LTSGRRPPRSAARASLAALALLACVGCGTTTPDPSAYREQARLATGAALSEVRTVEKLLTAEQDGKVLGGYATALLRSSSEALDSSTQTFTTYVPPEGQDRTADRTGELLDRAGDDLGAVVVAQHRGDESSYDELVQRLEQTATELQSWQEELQ